MTALCTLQRLLVPHTTRHRLCVHLRGAPAGLSALDILASANLINYFGQSKSAEKISIAPVVCCALGVPFAARALASPAAAARGACAHPTRLVLHLRVSACSSYGRGRPSWHCMDLVTCAMRIWPPLWIRVPSRWGAKCVCAA